MLKKVSIRNIFSQPISYILLFCTILFSTGILWGLPNVETWQSDSFAPFHPLIGLSQGFSFGYFNKYPLVHQLLLAILNLPVLIASIIRSNPLEGFQIFKFLVVIRSAEYATALILIDRIVSVIMGVLTVYFIYLCGLELFNKRTGIYTALIVSFNAVLNHYAHVAKPEVPYLFWAVIALYMLIRVVKYDRRGDYIRCALFTCFCFGTKDQGYAIFVLPFILYLVIYQVIYRAPGTVPIRVIFRKNLLIFLALFLVCTVVVQNIFLNYEGFLLRLSHLTGEGGQRSISYTLGPAGVFALFKDTCARMIHDTQGLPLFFINSAGMILFIIMYRKDRKNLLLNSIMIVASLSYYIFFVQLIRQSNVRFSLPQSVFLSVYGGYLLALLHGLAEGRWKIAFAGMLVLISVFSLSITLPVNANMMCDTRYRAEEWMNNNIPEGAVIEYYSYLHYLPRFPAGTNPYRIRKNVLGIEKRKPDYIVLTSHYYPRFLFKTKTGSGKIQNTRNIRNTKSEFAEFLPDLLSGRLGYSLVNRTEHNIPFFRRVSFTRISPSHILVFKRNSGPVKSGQGSTRGGSM